LNFTDLLLPTRQCTFTRLNDTQHNNPQPNDTQPNDTRHNDTQHKDIQYDATKQKLLICDAQLKVLFAILTIDDTQHNNTS